MNESWSQVHGNPDANESAKNFVNILLNRNNKAAEVTTVKINTKN